MSRPVDTRHPTARTEAAIDQRAQTVKLSLQTPGDAVEMPIIRRTARKAGVHLTSGKLPRDLETNLATGKSAQRPEKSTGHDPAIVRLAPSAEGPEEFASRVMSAGSNSFPSNGSLYSPILQKNMEM